jgi:hypothetical protein
MSDIKPLLLPGVHPDTYEVPSSSDPTKVYRVRYRGSGDGDPDYVALWECDCPAGQHGRPCRHIRAVSDLLNEENA